jgi:hypothetical protein
MTSTNTYIDQTIPYFYIIQHKKSKKMYAGSKYAKGCNPNTFMISGGYTTSSIVVNSIIECEGLNSFEILRIDTNLDGLSAYNYETLFLQCNNCAESNDWYNKHNNSGISFGTDDYTQSMLAKYNVEHNSQTKEFKQKYKQTCLNRYGCDNPMKNSTIREKAKQTCLNLYGYDTSLKNPIIREKAKQTNREKYGVDFSSQVPEFIEKRAITRRKSLLKKFECASESEIIEKIFYYEKKYNIERSRLNNKNPNLKQILTHFPKTAHKSITALYKIFKKSRFYIEK